MTSAHAKQVGDALRPIGGLIESSCTSPEGQRVHFVLLTWTDDGVVQHINNTPRDQCAQVMAQQIEIWKKGDWTPGPAR